ncbi:MAG TPA: hypothetical protein VEW67_09480 [Thermoleophilaceae bacterium]|nr:hypothetical protein [Thermoleophilaceae bacterium]
MGVTACGDDSDSDATASGGDGAALREKVTQLQDALYGSKAEVYCDGLTREARDATAAAVRKLKTSKATTCEEVVDELVPTPIPLTVAAEGRAAIVKVEIDGDKGTVTTKEPTDRPAQTAPFVKRNGEWLLDQALVPNSN